MASTPVRAADQDRAFGRGLIVMMVLGFVALCVAGFEIVRLSAQNREYTARVVHTLDVRQAIADFQIAVEQSETTRRGYILSVNPLSLAGYNQAERELAPRLSRLREMTRDNPVQTARIDKIVRTLAILEPLRERSIAQAASGDIAGARLSFVRDRSLVSMRSIRARLAAMTATETGLLARRSADQRESTRLSLLLTLAAAILIVVVAIVSLITVARGTRALQRSRNALRGFNETLEDQVAERTADLSRANEEIQRFAYIVSHDLRSPLVNVMGFTAELEAAIGPLAELVERAEREAPEIVTGEARLAAREDLPEAVGFIRTSTQKMDRLINAILQLSRQGRRTLNPEPLDVAALADATRASLRHIADDEGAEIEIRGPFPPVTADRLAVEQILSNLIENALKYTQPGRAARIVVLGRRENGRAVIAVEDNGRGIAQADHARVFDLFRRAGNQDRPGEGIGLAHVRALAYRLGGAIGVVSELGRGSTFSLSLPLAAPQDLSR